MMREQMPVCVARTREYHAIKRNRGDVSHLIYMSLARAFWFLYPRSPFSNESI